MPDGQNILEFEFYTNRAFLKNLSTGQPFLTEDNQHPPPNATWWEQMGNYFWQQPPSFKVDIPLQKGRWEIEDQQMLVRIQEFPDETRRVVYRRRFDNWLASVIGAVLYRPGQILSRYLELILLMLALLIGYLFYQV